MQHVVVGWDIVAKAHSLTLLPTTNQLSVDLGSHPIHLPWYLLLLWLLLGPFL